MLRKLGRRGTVFGMAIHIHSIAHLTAQQVISRHTEHFAADIPKRDINARNHVCSGATRSHIGEVAEDLVPDALDL